MSDELNELPESIRAKYLLIEVLGEVLQAHRDGRPSTTPCPDCGAPLTVRDVPGIGSFWVVCDNGHTLAHVNAALPRHNQ